MVVGVSGEEKKAVRMCIKDTEFGLQDQKGKSEKEEKGEKENIWLLGTTD